MDLTFLDGMHSIINQFSYSTINNQQRANSKQRYLLYGSCVDDATFFGRYYKAKVNETLLSIFTDLKIFEIPIEPFLDSHYSHKALLDYTVENVQNIDVENDLFQWIFCKTPNVHLKQYYFDNVESTKLIQMPMDLLPYLGAMKISTDGVIGDVERTKVNGLDHVVNIDGMNVNISNQDRVLNVWQNNSYWSLTDAKYLQSLQNNRPFIITEAMEPFGGQYYRQHDCNNVDIHFQVCKSWPQIGCVVVHKLDGAGWNVNHTAFHNKVLTKYSDQQIEQIFEQKTDFCNIIVKWQMSQYYYSDALVRHVMAHQLAEQYKECHFLGGFSPNYIKNTIPWGKRCNENNPRYVNAPDGGFAQLNPYCNQRYKFSINMENTASYGYTSEKIFHGLLGDTIPIYFGNKEVAKYINLDRIIYCDISDNILVDTRTEFGPQNQKLTSEEYKNCTKVERERKMLAWGVKKYAKYLQKCVDEVIAVDKNDTLYKWKLAQPIIANNEYENTAYDHSAAANAVIDTLKAFKSPIFD